MSEIFKCDLCGEPMPAGEEMFKFHGYSGPCPAPPLPRPPTAAEQVVTLTQQLTEAQQQRDALAAELEAVRQRAWPLLRAALTQGHAQQIDYQNGKHASFEHFMAHVDAAARDREKQLLGRALAAQEGA